MSILIACVRDGGMNNNVNNCTCKKEEGARIVVCRARKGAGRRVGGRGVNGGGTWLLASAKNDKMWSLMSAAGQPGRCN